MSKNKKPKIMGTTSEEQVVQEQHAIVPVQIIFHLAGVDVNKIKTPQGIITELSLISPTGIAVTVRITEDNMREFIKDLTGVAIASPQEILGLKNA